MAESIPVTTELILARDQYLAGLRELPQQAAQAAQGVAQAFAASPIKVAINTSAIQSEIAMAVRAGFEEGMESASTAASGGKDDKGKGGGSGGMFSARMAALLALTAATEMAEAYRTSNIESIMDTGDTVSSAKNELKDWRQQFQAVPVAGPLAKLMQDPTGMSEAQVELQIRAAQDQDAFTKQMGVAGEYRARAGADARIITTPGEFERDKSRINERYREMGVKNLDEQNAELEKAAAVHNDVLAQNKIDAEELTPEKAANDPALRKYLLKAPHPHVAGKVDKDKYLADLNAKEGNSFAQLEHGITGKFGLDANAGNLTADQISAMQTELAQIEERHKIVLDTLRDETAISVVRRTQGDQAAERVALIDKQKEQYAVSAEKYGKGFDQSDDGKLLSQKQQEELKTYDAQVQRENHLRDLSAQRHVEAIQGTAAENATRAEAAQRAADGDVKGAKEEEWQASQAEAKRVGAEKVQALRDEANATADVTEKKRLNAEADATEAANSQNATSAAKAHAAALQEEAQVEQRRADLMSAMAGATVQRAEGHGMEAEREELAARHDAERKELMARDHSQAEEKSLDQKQKAEDFAFQRKQQNEANDAREATRQTYMQSHGASLQAEREKIKYEFEGQFGVTGKGSMGGKIGEAGADSELGKALKEEEQAQLAAIRPNVQFGDAMSTWRKMQSAGLLGNSHMPGLNPLSDVKMPEGQAFGSQSHDEPFKKFSSAADKIAAAADKIQDALKGRVPNMQILGV